MKKLLAALVLATINSAFAGQIVLPTTAANVQLFDARYEIVPTKTAVREIPGCNLNNDFGQNCYETIVLESTEVIRVSVSYLDRAFTSEQETLSYGSISYPISAFSAADVQLLKSVYPQWKHAFSRIPAQFAKDKFSLNVSKEKRDIQVADMNKSYICPRNNESGDLLDPSCQDKMVYKTSFTYVLVATVSAK